MTDWRRYTGTQRLQIGWTVIAVGVFALVTGPGSDLTPDLLLPLWIAAVSVGWFVGLLALGLRDRSHWSRLVSQSSFERHRGTRRVDLEKLHGGHSVTVSTAIPGLLSQAHLTVRTPVENVDAEFTVELERVKTDGADRGITTGNETLDANFVISGSERNVNRLLSPDVQAALMDVDTPGTATVTGTAVVYEVPFTRMSSAELERIAVLTVELATRVETLAESA